MASEFKKADIFNLLNGRVEGNNFSQIDRVILFLILWFNLVLTFFKEVVWDSLEKAMAPHSSTLAWKIPWTEEPGRLQSMESLGVRHDWVTSLSLFTFMHWRRKWQPTPVFLPGESQGRGSLVGCHLWGRTESDATEATQQQQHFGIPGSCKAKPTMFFSCLLGKMRREGLSGSLSLAPELHLYTELHWWHGMERGCLR